MKKHILITAIAFVLASFSGFADDSVSAKAIWDKQCKKCHAEDGSGSTKLGQKLELLDYTKAESLGDMTDEELFSATKDGVEGTKMKGYAKKLSDDEINALVCYMRGFSKS